METSFRTSRWPIVCLVIGVALGLAGVVLAEDNEEAAACQEVQGSATENDAAVTPQDQAAEVGGLVAAIDKDTGELRAPTAEEMKQLDEQWGKFLKTAFGDRRSQKPFVGPDGRSRGMLCGPENMEFSLATIGPDGKLRVGNVTGAEQAKEWMKNPAASKLDDSR